MPAEKDYADIGSGGKYGGGGAESFAIVDAPTAFMQEVMPEAVDKLGIDRALQLATLSIERGKKGGELYKAGVRAMPFGSLLSPFIDPYQGAIKQTIDLLSLPNVGIKDGYITGYTPTGYIQQSAFGNTTFTGMPDPTYSGAFANLVNPPSEPIGGNDKIEVAPVDEVTGQCPDGYEFDANLNACRKITPTEYTAMTMPSAPAGRYARMGLLDQPPAGLLEAGFGSPADFAGANLAFRRASAPMSTYFTDPRSYEGYTLI